MSVLSLYESHLQNNQIQFDPAQKRAIEELEALYQQLIKKRLFFQKPPKGVYLWGGVGRGKTFAMDLFYSSLPNQNKTRLHFHRFMHFVHSELKRMQGTVDPLKQIAKAFSKKNQLLCFDEFHVSDIADATILGELLKYLFHYNVVLVATSNIEPNRLYENGLARDKFLPAIDSIYEHMNVVSFGEGKDYRLQFLSNEKCYHFPLNETTFDELSRVFQKLTFDQIVQDNTLVLCDRIVETKACAETVVWFSFHELCETARSSEDYIEIAKCFSTVLLSDVKKMGSDNEAAAKRFMHMVDEFYERHVTLIISAEVPIQELYSGTLISKAFQRTFSRLTEMQSLEYLGKPHLA